MVIQPLCEVFGYPVDNHSLEAERHRTEKLCPFNNNGPKCTKSKKKDPLGVCSIWSNQQPIVICPVRFRQYWKIINDSRLFLLSNTTATNFVTEVRLKNADDDNVGNIDVVIVDNTADGTITDFGILEIQAVYISGNVTNPFKFFVRETERWDGLESPRPDWLSSVKRLVRQLTVKGVIFSNWHKKMAIAVQKQFYLDHMPQLRNISEIPVEQADVAWLLYDFVLNPQLSIFEIKLERTVYMTFDNMLENFSRLEAGSIDVFTEKLKAKVKKKYRIDAPH